MICYCIESSPTPISWVLSQSPEHWKIPNHPCCVKVSVFKQKVNISDINHVICSQFTSINFRYSSLLWSSLERSSSSICLPSCDNSIGEKYSPWSRVLRQCWAHNDPCCFSWKMVSIFCCDWCKVCCRIDVTTRSYSTNHWLNPCCNNYNYFNCRLQISSSELSVRASHWDYNLRTLKRWHLLFRFQISTLI